MSEENQVKQALLAAWAEIDKAELSLADKLAAYERASRVIAPDILSAYDRMVARTAAGETLLGAPNVGDVLPDFLCPDAKGQLVSLASLLEDGPLVLSMNRGHWCPYCKLELRALAGAAGAVASCGAQIVSVVPETARFTQKIAADNSLPFLVLTDLDLSYALSLGLVTPPGQELQQLYAKAGIDLATFQNNPFWLLPLPATFVIGRDGRILARFVDPDFRRRMPIDEIVKALNASTPA